MWKLLSLSPLQSMFLEEHQGCTAPARLPISPLWQSVPLAFMPLKSRHRVTSEAGPWLDFRILHPHVSFNHYPIHPHVHVFIHFKSVCVCASVVLDTEIQVHSVPDLKNVLSVGKREASARSLSIAMICRGGEGAGGHQPQPLTKDVPRIQLGRQRLPGPCGWSQYERLKFFAEAPGFRLPVSNQRLRS